MISIIVVVFNRLDLTQTCLASIAEHTSLEHEVIVVDNASEDDTAEWLKSQPVRTVTCSENLGWGRGANVGSAASDAPLLVQLNNDTQVHDGWLEPLVDAIQEPGVGMACSRLVNPDGSLQHAGIRLFHDDNGVLTAANITQEQDTRDLEAGSMAACLLRADAWLQIGGIDPGFRNGYEDVDACLRMRAQGWKIRYAPSSTVTHIAHASGPERWAYTDHNIRRLHERWATRV